MSLPSFQISDVLASHEQSRQTRIVDAVVPEVTEIPLRAADLRAYVGEVGVKNFSRRGLLIDRPVNVLSGINFVFTSAYGWADFDERATIDEDAADAMADLLQPIDAHFREWSGIDDDAKTSPAVNLLAGTFTGKNPSDVNAHFDFQGARPQVSYKIYFEGDPRFSSVYYPGRYKLPSRLVQLSRVLGGVQPNTPTPQFKRKDSVEHVMPAEVVCVEPWNAYHSGPRDKEARGTTRGILAVSYDVSRPIDPPVNRLGSWDDASSSVG